MSARSRRSGWWLALAALAIVCVRPGIAAGKEAPVPVPEGSHVVKIGPQATVLVDQQGKVHMYDDPAEQARSCRSGLKCWGGALGALLFFGTMTYEDLTSANEAASGTLQRVGPPD